MTIPLAVSFPEVFIISSTGPAGTVQKSSMGTYLKMDEVFRFNRPVWKKEGDDLFIFFSPDSFWSVGPDTSSTSPRLYNRVYDLPYPTQTNWLFRNSKNEYPLDTQVQIRGENMKGESKNINTT